MTAPLQTEANRRNAQLSTGSKTAEGAAASRMNALKHGLTARQIVLCDKSPEDFEAFFSEILAVLKSGNPVEIHLDERIAICAWRLRRSYRIEAAMFENVRRSWANGTPTISSRIEHLFVRAIAHDDHLAKLNRYEITLERSLQRALVTLEHRQMRRANRG